VRSSTDTQMPQQEVTIKKTNSLFNFHDQIQARKPSPGVL
jgi:hypothetical protein